MFLRQVWGFVMVLVNDFFSKCYFKLQNVIIAFV